MRFLMTTIVALLVAVSSAQTAGPAIGTRDIPANYRGINATGVFEAKGLVTSFKETTNIRWRTPLPHFGNSSPVVVKGKVFVTCDPGWKSDNPILVCVNATDGTIPWQQEVDNLDAPSWTDEQRTEGKKLRAQEWAWVRKAGELNAKLAATTDEVEIRRLCDEGVAAGLGEAAPVREGPRKGKMAFPIFDNKNTLRGKQLKLMSDKGYFRHLAWFLDGVYAGNCYPSVVSDGTCVWVTSTQSGVACFDLDGKRQWVADIRRTGGKCAWREPCGMITASPTLAGDTLLVGDFWGSGTPAGCLIALDAATGKARWRTALNYSAGGYFEGFTPVVLDLGGVPVVYVISGDVIRLADGKILGTVQHPDYAKAAAAKQRSFGCHAPSIGSKDRLYIGYRWYGGGENGCPGGAFAYKLALDGETLKVELLWENRDDKYQNGFVLHGDRLYLPHPVDLATGKAIGKAPAGSGECPFVADGKLVVPDRSDTGGSLAFYALPDLKPLGTGKLPVAPVEGEKATQQIARLGHTGWGWGDSSPTADGACIYWRSHDDLWCIGAPKLAE